MNTFTLPCIVGLWVCAGLVAAAEFDGSKPLLCATVNVNECTPDGICERITAESIKAPDFLRINVKKKTISVTAQQQRRASSRILKSAILDEKLVLQGMDEGIEGVRDGLGWSLAIDQNTGKMVLTASGEAVAFIIFGACTII